MHRHLLFLLMVATALLLLFLPTALSLLAVNSLSNCNRTFSCGSFANVSYPFTGGDRPTHCGPPQFRLSCVGDSPELTVGSLTYRVRALDQTRRSLVLSRTDLYNNTCLQQYANATLNSTIFTLASNGEDLTLLYDCSWVTFSFNNLFSCEINGNLTYNYYFIGAVPTDPILNVSQCNGIVMVPIRQSTVIMLAGHRLMLTEALMKGFEVNYTNPYEDQCVMCGGIGGECAYDSDQGKPICICGDQICSTAGGAFLIGALIFEIAVIFTCKVLFFKNKKDSEVEQSIRDHGSLAPKRYQYTDLKKMTKSFSEKLGQGGFGVVYKGKTKDGCLVAVKILMDSKSSPKEFINEIMSISRTSHVNVITLLGFCYEGKTRALIFKYMSNGSLDKFIYSRRALITSSSLECKVLYKIAIGIARGLEYLHQGCNTRILHFDIKPENILLDIDFTPKISDFGQAKLCHGQESAVSNPGMRGTVGFIAPEVACRSLGRVSHKSDVYSYGMLLLDMVGMRYCDVKVSNSIGKRLKLPMKVTEEEEVLVRKMVIVSLWCIQTSPSDRPSIGKVIEMLDGSLESLQMPPKPILYSPSRRLSNMLFLELQ
ncbi:hypothetical protein BT93_F3376 [Corymbia citriodora subsp. variegata]|nr:hypothetical protein BT93_F3376 [Corymbia citriodora subsp. variegata]